MFRWENLLIVSAILCVIIFSYYMYKAMRYKKIISDISNVIIANVNEPNLTIKTIDDIYQISYQSNNEILIKIIDMSPKDEVIITNSGKVVINDDISGWKKSSKPNFVNGIDEFIKLKSEKEAIKIIVLYPDCHKIIKYKNESDVFVVEKNQKIDNIYYLKFKDLDEFIKKY
ncbi:MAG: hypothetical protein KAU02_01950 [Tenericutes bacterium]|nr:hypothetical protein [Mycoplasmatota bacterium]